MKSKIKVYGGLFFLAFGLTLLLKQFLTQTPDIKQKNIAMKRVLVTKQELHPHQTLSDDFCESKDFPEDLLPDGAIQSLSELQHTKSPFVLTKGEVITKAKFTKEIPLSSLLSYERAFFLPLKEAPKLLPNDRVDLVLTQKIKKIKDGMVKERMQSQVILPYARVIEVQKKKGQGKEGIVLAIPKGDIAKLALAQEIGKLSFVKYPDLTEEMESLRLISKEKDFTKRKKQIQKKPKQASVTLIRGKQVEQYAF